MTKYRYSLYDRKGRLIVSLFGNTRNIVTEYLKNNAWSSIHYSMCRNFTTHLGIHKHCSKVYGRDLSKENNKSSYTHCYVIRESLKSCKIIPEENRLDLLDNEVLN